MGAPVFRPEVLRPQIVKGLNGPVIVRFVLRGEEHGAAHIQAEADEGTQLAWLAPPTDGTLVVELGQVRQAQALPRLQQVVPGGARLLRGRRRRLGRVGKVLYGRAGLHDLPPGQPAGHHSGRCEARIQCRAIFSLSSC